MAPFEVFFRTCPRSKLRREIAEACWERWGMFAGVEVKLLQPEGDSFPFVRDEEFHWRARVRAEAESERDYLFVDDDVLPPDERFIDWIREDWAEQGSSVAMLGGVSAIWSERSPRLANLEPAERYLTVEALGGLALVRKGVIPFHTFAGSCHSQDGVIHDWIQKNGYTSVVSKRLIINHLGFGLSESSLGWWLRC